MANHRKSPPNARGKIETRSSRMSFSMTPTIKTRLTKLRVVMAKSMAPVGVSLNDVITAAVTRGLDLIEKENFKADAA